MSHCMAAWFGFTGDRHATQSLTSQNFLGGWLPSTSTCWWSMKVNAVQIQLIPVSSSKRLVSLFDHEFFVLLIYSWALYCVSICNQTFFLVIFHVSVSITWTLDMLCKTGNIKTLCMHLLVCLPCFYAQAYINQDETLREGPFFFVNQPLLDHVWASCCLLVGVEKMWKSNIFQTCPSQ